MPSSYYGYTPSGAWCIVFIVLFSLSAAIHAIQALRSRYWIIFPTLVLGALIEVLGWAGRYWSSQNEENLTPFLMQICTLILAPVFFSAYCYAVLGSAIHKLGAQYSALPARWYFIIFILADLVSLILQAIGGGQAASSASESAPTQTATNIMVVGIIFQLVTMGIFIMLGIDFCIRANARKAYAFRLRMLEKSRRKSEASHLGSDLEATASPTPTAVDETGSHGATPDVEKAKLPAGELSNRQEMRRWWIMAGGVAVASAMIFIRGIYRSIELVQGWDGYLMTHQIYQNVLDGIPMVIAVAVFNIINPLWVLPRKEKWGSYY